MSGNSLAQLVALNTDLTVGTGALALEVALEGEPGKQKAPARFRIFKKGVNESLKGPFIFDTASAEKVMRWAKDYNGNRLFVDLEHAVIKPDGRTAPAMAWLSLEVTELGELWATNVDWTEVGRQKVESREYRFISPLFKHVEGHVEQMVNVALTNYPALIGLEPLSARPEGAGGQNPPATTATPKEPSMNPLMIAVLAALSFRDNMDPNEAASQVAKLKADAAKANALEGKVAALEADLLKQKETLAGAQSMLTDFAALAGVDTIGKAMGVLKSQKENALKVTALEAELVTLRERETSAKLEALFAKGKAEGKINAGNEPGMREFAKKFGLEALDGFIAHAPVNLPPSNPPTPAANPSTPAGAPGAQPSPATVALSAPTAEEIAVAKQLGVDVAKLQASKAKLGNTVMLSNNRTA